MDRKYAPVIDLARCAAALLVTFYHFFTTWPHQDRALLTELGYPPVADFNAQLYFGFVGVEIFFVISGYVIAASCVGRTPRTFLISRAIRLLPILWIAALIGFVLLAAHGVPMGPLLRRAAGSALLIPGGPYLDPVVWTLVVEVVFYAAVWFLLLLFPSRMPAALIWLARWLALASLVSLFFERQGVAIGNFLPELLLLRHGGFFALGIFIWAGTNNHGRHLLFALVALASCALEILSIVEERNGAAGTAYGVALPWVVFALGAALVWWGARHLQPQASPLVRTLGLMTYPIYLIHETVGAATTSFVMNQAGLPWAPALATGYVVVLGLSWALVAMVEPSLRGPFRSLLEAIVPGRTAMPRPA